jgi:RNA polymerase sigma factor (sigma-70 family)
MKQYCLYSPEGPVQVTEEVYKAYHSCRNKERYLYRVEKDRVLSLDRAIEDHTTIEADISCNQESLEDEVINNMIAKMIRACIGRLEADEVELIQALYYQGISMREYANSIDVAEGTVRYRHKQVLKRLRQFFEE